MATCRISKGFDSILVVVDQLSKYGHFLPLKHPFTAKVVVAIFMKQVVELHRFHKSIVSDRDKIFFSNFWDQLFCKVLSRKRVQHSTPKPTAKQRSLTSASRIIWVAFVGNILKSGSSGYLRSNTSIIPRIMSL